MKFYQVTEHHGHGIVAHEDCQSNDFQFTVMDANGNHNGWLEYVNVSDKIILLIIFF